MEKITKQMAKNTALISAAHLLVATDILRLCQSRPYSSQNPNYRTCLRALMELEQEGYFNRRYFPIGLTVFWRNSQK